MKVIFVSSVSATLELVNNAVYYAPSAFEVFVNGQSAGIKNENVFSLFGLKPDTMYEVKVGNKKISFRTETESACIDVRKNGA